MLVNRILFSLAHKHKRIRVIITERKMKMFVFLILCLCLCASENSIRQISGFVLLLMLMSRVFSLAYAYVMLMLHGGPV